VAKKERKVKRMEENEKEKRKKDGKKQKII
jgi:hypothetical protein